jgi:hypothetical protein
MKGEKRAPGFDIPYNSITGLKSLAVYCEWN